MKDELTILKPSIALQIRARSHDEATAVIYYAAGRRRITLDLTAVAASFLIHFRDNGIDRITAEKLEGDARDVYKLLCDRDMVSSSLRESWLGVPEFQRFDRQMRLLSELLPPFLSPAQVQRQIEAARVVIVGLGGTGTHMLQGLAEMGVKQYLLVDPDVVELSNLNRQPIYSAESIGQRKVNVARGWLGSFLPSATAICCSSQLSELAVSEAVGHFDPSLIVNCADQPSVVSTTEECLKFSSTDKVIPVLVAGGYFLLNSFSGPYIEPGRSACLSCDPSIIKDSEHLHAVGGNTGFVASLGASIALMSALASITGAFENPLAGIQIAVEFPEFEVTRKHLALNPDCGVCGGLVSKHDHAANI